MPSGNVGWIAVEIVKLLFGVQNGLIVCSRI